MYKMKECISWRGTEVTVLGSQCNVFHLAQASTSTCLVLACSFGLYMNFLLPLRTRYRRPEMMGHEARSLSEQVRPASFSGLGNWKAGCTAILKDEEVQ